MEIVLDTWLAPCGGSLSFCVPVRFEPWVIAPLLHSKFPPDGWWRFFLPHRRGSPLFIVAIGVLFSGVLRKQEGTDAGSWEKELLVFSLENLTLFILFSIFFHRHNEWLFWNSNNNNKSILWCLFNCNTTRN